MLYVPFVFCFFFTRTDIHTYANTIKKYVVVRMMRAANNETIVFLKKGEKIAQ